MSSNATRLSLLQTQTRITTRVMLYSYNLDGSKLFLFGEQTPRIPTSTYGGSHMVAARQLAEKLFGEDVEVTYCGSVEAPDEVRVLYRTFNELPLPGFDYVPVSLDRISVEPGKIYGNLVPILREGTDLKVYLRTTDT